MGGVSFFGDSVQVLTLLWVSVICSECFFRQFVALSGHFAPLMWVPETRCQPMLIPVNNFSQTVCHHKKGTCSFWVVFRDKHFCPYNYFSNVDSWFSKRKKLPDSSSYGWSVIFWAFFWASFHSVSHFLNNFSDSYLLTSLGSSNDRWNLSRFFVDNSQVVLSN